MKIYTRTGDEGSTGLFGGPRVSKDDDRIEAYGDVDELNSVIGALIAALGEDDELVTDELTRIQSDLFAIGAWLATSPESSAAGNLTPLTSAPAALLEDAVDRIDAGLAPLMQFILPGGHPTAAWAHISPTWGTPAASSRTPRSRSVAPVAAPDGSSIGRAGRLHSG